MYTALNFAILENSVKIEFQLIIIANSNCDSVFDYIAGNVNLLGRLVQMQPRASFSIFTVYLD